MPAPLTRPAVPARRALLALLATVLLAAPSSDARADRPGFTLQVDPLTTALGFVHLQLEVVVAPHWSFYVGPSLKLFPGLLAEEGDVAYTGLGAEVGVRYYFAGRAPYGAWALVRGVGARLATDDPPEAHAFGGYVSALGGYTWIFGERWVVSLGLGIQYLDYTVAGSGPKGVLPAAHTAIGVAF
ncbi:MAG: DUF3575 domain-containing protein [Myxococcota bacterium]